MTTSQTQKLRVTRHAAQSASKANAKGIRLTLTDEEVDQLEQLCAAFDTPFPVSKSLAVAFAVDLALKIVRGGAVQARPHGPTQVRREKPPAGPPQPQSGGDPDASHQLEVPVEVLAQFAKLTGVAA